MFDIGWSELLVIVVVAIVVVGPKELPKLMRTFGHYAGKLRRAASDFQRQFDEAMRDTEVAEVKKAIETMRTEAASLDLKATLDEPVMLPTQVAAPAKAEETALLVPPAVKVAEAKTEIKAETKPKPARKSASTKPKSSPKSSGAKRGKPPAEPGP